MSSLGNKLKEARKQRKLTQAELAEGLMSRSYISQIEKGLAIPSYRTLVSLSNRLEQDINYFIEEQELKVLAFTDQKKILKNAQVQLELNNYKKTELLINQIQSEYLSRIEDKDKGLYYWILGEVWLNKNKWEKSIECLLKSMSFLQNMEDELDLIKCLNSLSKAYINSSSIESALQRLNEASILLMKNQISEPVKIEVLLNMAICHGRIGEFRSAIRLCKEANYINSITNKNYKSGQIFMTLGICYKKLGELENAQKFYLKAEKLFDVFDSKFNKAGTLINLGILSRKMKKYELSLEYINSSKEIFSELEEVYQVFNCTIELIRTYFNNGQITKAKNLALETVDTIPEKFSILKCQTYELLSDLYILEENTEEALNYIQLAEELVPENRISELIIKKARIYMKLENFKIAAELFNSTFPPN